MKKLHLLAVSAAVLSGISTLQAGTFNNSVGLTGVGVSPAFTLDFNNTPGLFTNSLVTTQYAFAGVTFGSQVFYDGNSSFGACGFNDMGGDCLTNFTTTSAGVAIAPISPVSILFSTPQSYAAFALVTDGAPSNPSSTTFTAYRGNNIVDQFTAATSSSNNQVTTVPNFFGFYGETNPFDRIVVSSSGGNYFLLDNLQISNRVSVSSTPEPGTVGMLAFGGVGIFVMLRRRHRSA